MLTGVIQINDLTFHPSGMGVTEPYKIQHVVVNTESLLVLFVAKELDG